MHEDRSHPLLAQIPLTVSPFISLPTATTLPYTYKTLPSTLPPSSTGNATTSTDEKAKYVVSPTGHAAHPDNIIASCKALQSYIQKIQDDADGELKSWETDLKARELAEKRRVAPGWLDSDDRILEPERMDNNTVGQNTGRIAQLSLMDADASSAETSGLEEFRAPAINGEGEELDRAFGGLSVTNTSTNT